MAVFYRIHNKNDAYLLITNPKKSKPKYLFQKNNFTYWNSLKNAETIKTIVEKTTNPKAVGLFIEKISFQEINSWKYSTINRSDINVGDVFTIRNIRGEYPSLNGNVTEDIIKAKYYTSISKLKSAMKRIFNPKAMLLAMGPDGKFHMVDNQLMMKTLNDYEIVQIHFD